MDISELLQSLSPEDVNKLQETAKAIMGDAAKSGPAPKKETAQDLAMPLLANPDLMQKMMKIAGMLSTRDQRMQFFVTLKPLLSEQRQKKVDAAIMILQILRIQAALKEDPELHLEE